MKRVYGCLLGKDLEGFGRGIFERIIAVKNHKWPQRGEQLTHPEFRLGTF